MLSATLLTDQVRENANDLLRLAGALLGDAASRLVYGHLVVAVADLVAGGAARGPETVFETWKK